MNPTRIRDRVNGGGLSAFLSVRRLRRHVAHGVSEHPQRAVQFYVLIGAGAGAGAGHGPGGHCASACRASTQSAFREVFLHAVEDRPEVVSTILETARREQLVPCDRRSDGGVGRVVTQGERGAGIRSERRLCEEVHLNLAYRWFCRLGLEDAVPEHSTFSKNRHGRFRDSDVLRHVFESVLGRCMPEGLVKGEGIAIDASIIRADASSARGVPGSGPIDWGCVKGQSRAVREYLEALEEANPAGTEAAEMAETSPPPMTSSIRNWGDA